MEDPSNSNLTLTKNLFLIIFLLAFSGCGGSTSIQKGVVYGTIKDNITKQGVSNVAVTISDKSTTTDINGIFTISDVPVGQQVLNAGRVGYEAYSQNVTVHAGSNNLGEIFLIPKTSAVIEEAVFVGQDQVAVINWENSVINAKGTGTPPTNMPAGEAKLMARRAAEADAYRNISESINAMRVNSDNVVKNYVQNNDALRTSISGLVKGAQIGNEREIGDIANPSEYIYEVEAKLSFYGTSSIEKVIADSIVSANSVSYVSGDGYTGLILDARNLELKAALHPKILVENTNQVIYSENTVDRAYLIAEGMAVYTTSLEQAMKLSKAGTNPLTVTAKSVSGSVYKTDVVVDSPTAQTIRNEDAKSNFLKKGAVIIVI